jgi:hypothetical protein
MKDGKQLRTRRLEVSADGKTLKTTVKGTDPKGSMMAGTDVFDKE